MRERLAPVRRARELVDELGVQQIVLEAERLATTEGEHALVLRVRGVKDDCAVDYTLGLVVGDEHYVRIDAVPAEGRSIHPFVRELVVGIELGLGALRRRRYLYTPPPGWTAHPRGLNVEWLAPEFPRDPSVITVLAASPTTSALAGTPFITARFHAATLHRTALHDVATLQDDRFTYSCTLEAPAAQLDTHRGVFAKLIDTIQPLPTPQVELAHGLAASWVD